MPLAITGYRIFIASPGGLQAEREQFRKIIEEFNWQNALPRSIMFIPVGWEDTLGGVGRPQETINDDLRPCDYFLILLWDRWGMSPDLASKPSFTSGTEEEFHLAKQCFADPKVPMRQIVIFFKAVESRQLSDPGDELKKVIAFQKDLESKKEYLYHRFDDLDKFSDLLKRFLNQWVLDHEQGKSKKAKVAEAVVPLADPIEAVEIPPTQENSPVSKLVAEARDLTTQGRFTEAESAFARAVEAGGDPEALWAYGSFLSERGNFSQAESVFNRLLTTPVKGRRKWAANAYVELGNLSIRRNRPAEAEQLFQEALTASLTLDLPATRAQALRSLGRLKTSSRELKEAESLLNEASSIFRRLDHRHGIAQTQNDLGEVHRLRGSFDEAKRCLQEALIIFRGLKNETGVASSLNNIGLVYIAQGDLPSAEESIRESLYANTKLQRIESMALNHTNLGDIQDLRGNYAGAIKEFEMARELYQRLGLRHRIDIVGRRIDITRERLQATERPASPAAGAAK